MYEQEMGVSQHLVSCSCQFEINTIVKSAIKGSEAPLLEDDFALCVRAESLFHMRIDLCNFV